MSRRDTLRSLCCPASRYGSTPPRSRLPDIPETRMLTDSHGLRLFVRRLNPGERRRTGDLWWDGATLRVLVLPWWRRGKALTKGHSPHYRVTA